MSPRATTPSIPGKALQNESAQIVSIHPFRRSGPQRPLRAEIVHRPRALSSDKSPFCQREMVICRIGTVCLDLLGPMKNLAKGACHLCTWRRSEMDTLTPFDGCRGSFRITCKSISRNVGGIASMISVTAAPQNLSASNRIIGIGPIADTCYPLDFPNDSTKKADTFEPNEYLGC